ncbi:MAG: YdeI/OmpD-associated family protein [Calditrichota bacterium]
MPKPYTRSDGVATFHASSGAEWRTWLETNHNTKKSVWLIIFRKESNTSSVYYDEAVDEALCFGWIDSKPNKRDDQSYFQFFSKRNPRSNWSKVNKQKVERLLTEGRIAEPGHEMIRLAKETGTWTALEDVDNLVVPPDLRKAFDSNPTAFTFWEKFPPSTRRGILEWIFNAKREETRAKRIAETVEKAAEDIRANQYRQPKKK